MTEQHKDNEIDALAARWVARRDRGPLTPDEQAALDAWLAADRRHAGAWTRANVVYGQFDRLRVLAAEFDRGGRHAAADGSPASRARRRFLWLGGAMAAGLAGFALWQWPARRRFATQLGEVLRVPLDDGSTILLNSDSVVAVAYSASRRRVQLLRGEALFDVAKDPARPFVVDALDTSVTAVGTSFTVQRMPGQGVEVMVREGVVEFVPQLARAAVLPVRLAADTLAVASDKVAVQVRSLDAGDVQRRLAWRDGMLSFDGDTLAHAAMEFARYSRTRIVIRDPSVAERRVVGRYSATDPAGFAKAVALGMHLRADRRGDAIYLMPPERHASR